MKTPVEVLKEARRLLVEKGWCQGAYARNVFGKAALHWDERADSFCAKGAVYRVTGLSDAGPAMKLLESCLPSGHDAIAPFNDQVGRNRDDVVDLFDRAIAKAEAAP